MLVSTQLTPQGIAALESLRQLGFRIDSNSGAYRLRRSDNSQAQLYLPTGVLSFNGHLGNITDVTLDTAAINGLKVAQAILKDEAQRLAMPRPQLGKEGSWVAPQG
jgi:hypothetical protein